MVTVQELEKGRVRRVEVNGFTGAGKSTQGVKTAARYGMENQNTLYLDLLERSAVEALLQLGRENPSAIARIAYVPVDNFAQAISTLKGTLALPPDRRVKLIVLDAGHHIIKLARRHTREQLIKQGKYHMGEKEVIIEDPESLPGYTPVVIRRGPFTPWGRGVHGLTDVLPFGDVWQMAGRERRTRKGTIRYLNEPIYVFAQGTKNPRWVPVRAVYRHAYRGDLVRINTACAVVDTSPNHSVYLHTWNGGNGKPANSERGHQMKLADARTIKVGDRLKTAAPISSHGFFSDQRMFVGTKDLAWLYGIFAGDGCAFIGPTHKEVIISAFDDDVKERCARIMEENFNAKVHQHDTTRGKRYGLKGGVGVMVSSKPLVHKMRSMFYTSEGHKRVPFEVLNAPAEVQQAFFEGYMMADGNVRQNGSSRFTTNSPTLAQGILAMMDPAYSIRSEMSRPADVPYFHLDVELNVEKRHTFADRGLVRRVSRIPYNGYLYDFLNTPTGYYGAGVGLPVVHNSFELRGYLYGIANNRVEEFIDLLLTSGADVMFLVNKDELSENNQGLFDGYADSILSASFSTDDKGRRMWYLAPTKYRGRELPNYAKVRMPSNIDAFQFLDLAGSMTPEQYAQLAQQFFAMPR